MNAYVSKEELALLPANRISYPEHYADAQAAARARVGLMAWFARWMERRTGMAELAKLTDRELADVGLQRADLGWVLEPRFIDIHR